VLLEGEVEGSVVSDTWISEKVRSCARLIGNQRDRGGVYQT